MQEMSLSAIKLETRHGYYFGSIEAYFLDPQ
jgi:hypothetical protein